MAQEHNLLSKHKLRITACRLAVLRHFLSENKAFSQPDLERAFKDKFDRVTLYRTLSSFEEAGLIHAIKQGYDATNYALCGNSCMHTLPHQHAHAHFKCSNCAELHCLEDVQIPDLKLPKGYVVKNQSYFLEGLCSKCCSN